MMVTIKIQGDNRFWCSLVKVKEREGEREGEGDAGNDSNSEKCIKVFSMRDSHE